VPAICWSAGTNCSSITKCGDQFRSCTSPNATYSCAEMRCEFTSSSGDGGVTECGDPAFPVACPATAEVPRLCWSPGTICSTLNRCGNDFKSCLAAGYKFSCTEMRCVPDTSAPGPDAGTTPAADASAPATDAAVPATDAAAPATDAAAPAADAAAPASDAQSADASSAG
jgi:hypothetical protein